MIQINAHIEHISRELMHMQFSLQHTYTNDFSLACALFVSLSCPVALQEEDLCITTKVHHRIMFLIEIPLKD